MKKYFFYAAAAIAMASCTNNEFFGDSPTAVGKGHGEISFGSQSTNITRADFKGTEAAKKLNNNFIVYGFKYNVTNPTPGDEAIDGAGDQVVFNLYNVNYTAGTANTTESNTADWEYVGLANHDGSINPQTIKYWDYSANGYVYSAVSGIGIEATKTLTGTTVYNKGWTVSIPAGGDLSTLYASKREPIVKANFGKQVDLTFYNLATKIRFAMYEIIPGYSVHIDNLYYDNLNTATSTNFAIDGNFVTTNATGKTDLTVTYNDGTGNTVLNTPKVDYTTGASDGQAKQATYMIFGTNIQATDFIGTNSIEATYDQADGEYTYILPYLSQSGEELSLKVDYTLTSTDNSGETIKVTGATAKVPYNFLQWKENFAYTYIFKISDNTNGSTGTDDGGNPVVGLYPITFDAVVIDSENGIQETITSVADPSITTYQKGVVVTKNDEYVAGDIFFENDAKDVSTYHVYEVNNYGNIENITEEVVANWKNNFCVLTEITTIDASTLNPAGIPLSDDTYISKTANQAKKFTAVAGKTYVIVNNTADNLDPTTAGAQCKVVKVAGTLAAAPTYTLTQSTDASSIIADWTTTAHSVNYQLVANSPAAGTSVLGARPDIKVFKSAEDVTTSFVVEDVAVGGYYKIKPSLEALAAGKIENGDYTVKFTKQDGTVLATGDATFNVNYSIAANTAIIVAGKNANITPTVGGATITKATITGVPAGITITETGTAGTYNVKVAPTMAAGVYDISFAGKTVTITVNSYAFDGPVTITMYHVGPQPTATLTLNKTEGTGSPAAASGVAYTALDGRADAIATATGGDGVYTITPVKGGTYTLSYENASTTVTVNKYTLTGSITSIKKRTGSTTLTLELNDAVANASTASVVVNNGSGNITTGFSLTTNGQKLIFGNVVNSGIYTISYLVGGAVVAAEVITVTE